MKFKILMAVTVLFLTIGSAYFGYKIGKKQQQEVSAAEIEEANVQKLDAEIKDEQIFKLKQKINEWEIKYLAEFENNYQEPEEYDKQVNEFVEFVPDPIPEVKTIIKEVYKEDDRKAITHYKYTDVPNKYSASFEILYDYKDLSFKITPHNLEFEPQKERPFCLSVVLNSNSAGTRFDFDLWRFRFSSGIYVTNQFSPVVGISIGWRF